MNVRKSVLIIGGAGFIGYGLARILSSQRDYRLTIADDFSSGQRDKELEDLCVENGIDVIDADFTSARSFDSLDDRYDHVYVLASVVGVNRCLEEPEEVIRINTGIILNTTQWISRSRPTRVLFASSSENYAATTDLFGYVIPTPEEVPLCIADTRHPRFTYAVTKILGESAFFSYGRRLGIHTTVVRYQNIFGPRMGFKHAIPHIIERIYFGEDPVKIYGHDQTRAFGYRSDAAAGTVLALESDMSNQQVYHIGSDREITIEALTRTIGRIMDYDGLFEPAPTYSGSVARRCPDITKSRNELRYEPKVSLEDGLATTVDWYKAYFDSGEPIRSGGFRAPDKLSFHDKDLGNPVDSAP